MVQSLEGRDDYKAIGPGHADIFFHEGVSWLNFHFCDGTTARGASMLGMAQIEWSEDGWPVVAAAL